MPDDYVVRHAVTTFDPHGETDMSASSLLFRAHAARQLALYTTDVGQLRVWLYRVGDDAVHLLRRVRELERGQR